jgi:hypothetical protein
LAYNREVLGTCGASPFVSPLRRAKSRPLNFTPRASLFAVSAGVLFAGGSLFAWWMWRRSHRDAREIERRRREYVNRVGRLTQGEVLDIVEGENAAPAVVSRGSIISTPAPLPAASGSPPRLLIYRYTVAGVVYETAQELSWFPAGVEVPAPGRIASVKYDPVHPSNSILVAESRPGWRERAAKPAVPRKDNSR